MKQVVVATHNKHKVAEIRAILARPDWEFLSLDELGITEEAVEDADSFAGNARIKAAFAHDKTGLAALADDSGLVVDALKGAPGVYSSRYAGPEADDTANNSKLLRKLEGVPVEDRGARFVCALVFIDTDGTEILAEGSVAGRIAYAQQGNNGFGYDPLFEVASHNYTCTMAELLPEEKNALSHRSAALMKLGRQLDQDPLCHSEQSEESIMCAEDPSPTAQDDRSAILDDRGTAQSHSGAAKDDKSVVWEGGQTTSPSGDTTNHCTKKEIVAFDFDGTLIDASSPVRLIRRLNKERIMPKWSIFKSMLWGLRYKMGNELDQSQPRRYVFSSFTDFAASDANAIMHNLYNEELRLYLRPQALEALAEHKAAGRIVIIVSASFEPIIEACCKDLDIEYFLCTQMEVKDGVYTGETVGEPPEGEQKLVQFTSWADEQFGPESWELHSAYGDHFSDVPLMETARYPIPVDPDRRLSSIAEERGWKIHVWQHTPPRNPAQDSNE